MVAMDVPFISIHIPHRRYGRPRSVFANSAQHSFANFLLSRFSCREESHQLFRERTGHHPTTCRPDLWILHGRVHSKSWRIFGQQRCYERLPFLLEPNDGRMAWTHVQHLLARSLAESWAVHLLYRLQCESKSPGSFVSRLTMGRYSDCVRVFLHVHRSHTGSQTSPLGREKTGARYKYFQKDRLNGLLVSVPNEMIH